MTGVTVESAPVTVSSSEPNMISEAIEAAQKALSNSDEGSMGVIIGGAVGAVVVLRAIGFLTSRIARGAGVTEDGVQ